MSCALYWRSRELISMKRVARGPAWPQVTRPQVTSSRCTSQRLKVIRRFCPSRERRSTIAAATALHVLAMPRYCTCHPWGVGSLFYMYGFVRLARLVMQRARSGDAGGLRRDIAAAAHASSRDHHLLWLGSLVCARLGVGHRKRLGRRMVNFRPPAAVKCTANRSPRLNAGATRALRARRWLRFTTVCTD